MEGALGKGFDAHVRIHTPLIRMTKRETVLFAKTFPGCMNSLAHSWTCYDGGDKPCGSCHACLLRKKGFTEAGEVDLAMKEE
jgi:7-cyano-7-deazaguanine synthase